MKKDSIKEKIKLIKKDLNGFPNLIVEESNKDIHIVGEIIVKERKFKIKVVLLKDFPNTLPVIYETEGKIPRKAWCHINDDGSCCLAVDAEQRKLFRKKDSISVYFNRLVIPYFENQVFYSITNRFVKEMPHGRSGIIKFYYKELNINSKTTLYSFLKLLENGSIKGKVMCGCGERKLRKDCHGPLLWKMNYLSKDQIQKDLIEIYGFTNYQFPKKKLVKPLRRR